jgi:hypothetical protein
VWFHRPGHDGQWWPIRDKGIRLGARRVRGFLDMVNAAAPLEAEWRRHSSRYGRREGRPPSAASEELRRDNERAVSLSTGTVEVEAAALVPTTARDSGVVPRRSSSRNPEMMD